MKKIWFYIGLLIATGAVLMIFGSAIGAKRWIYIDFEGVHVGGSKNAGVENDIKELDLKKFTNIDIDVASYGVEFIDSDHYGFESKSNNQSDITWDVENETLKVSENGFKVFNYNLNFFSNDYKPNSIKVYLPKAEPLDRVNIKTSSGNVSISQVTCSQLKLTITSGNAILSDNSIDTFQVQKTSGNLTMDNCVIESSNIRTTSGLTKIANIKSKGLYIKSSNGNIRIDGEFLGDTELHTISGKVEIKLSDEASAYNKSFHLLSGNLYINGEKTKGFNDIDKSGASNNLKINTTSGNIKVDFK